MVAAFYDAHPGLSPEYAKIIPAELLQEIYCQCSINMCEVRDPKGFITARGWIITPCSGLGFTLVPPKNPVLDTEHFLCRTTRPCCANLLPAPMPVSRRLAV